MGKVPRAGSCCLIEDQLPIMLGFPIHLLCVVAFFSKPLLLCKLDYINKKGVMGALDRIIVMDPFAFFASAVE